MRSPAPVVSVVIPAFNAAAHLRATLESVRAQTFPSFEAIVVDDGSTDGTRAIVDAMQREDPRIRLVTQPNAGVGAARNTGIHHARGRYIAPLDADDLWAPRKLARQVAAMESGGPGVGLVYCWSHNIDQQDRVLSYWHAPRVEGRIGAAMLLGNFINSASVPLLRASALASVGTYLTRREQDGGQGCEDWDLSARIAARFRFRCVPEYLVGYRQAATTMSLNCENMARSYATMIRRACARHPDLPSALLAWSAGRFYSYLANKCYGWSDYPGALRYVGKVLAADPAAWLNPRNFRIAALSLIHACSGGRWRRFPSPPPLPVGVVEMLRVVQTGPAHPRSWFERIQQRRFEQALRHARQQPTRLKVRDAVAC